MLATNSQPHEKTDREMLRDADVLSLKSLGFFTERVFNTLNPATEYNHNWHIDCIAEHLRAVEAGEIRRLIINMPPRELKTISVSIAFTAWLLGHYPSEQIVGCSYSKELSLDMSVKTRDILRSDWFQRIFPKTILKGDQDEKGKFATTLGGQRFATSVGGTITGMGGNYLILDDPLNPEEAVSEIERKAANHWVKTTFMSRFNDDRTGKLILVMQRLHADDTTGLIESMGNCTKLMLPAQFAKKEIIHVRGKIWNLEPNECMDKVRRPVEILQQKLKDLGPLDYACQYLQNPTPEEGAFFKRAWLKFYDDDDLPEGCRFYISSDFAVSEGEGDFTVHMVVGVSPDDDIYIVDLYREQTDSDTWCNALIDMILDWKPLETLEEKGVIEKAVDPLLKKLQSERQALCFRRKVPSITDKVTRAQAIRGRMAGGRVFFPTKKPFVAELLKEVFEFPNGTYDDQVDALSLFGRCLPSLRKGNVSKPKPNGRDEFKAKPVVVMDLINRMKRQYKRDHPQN